MKLRMMTDQKREGNWSLHHQPRKERQTKTRNHQRNAARPLSKRRWRSIRSEFQHYCVRIKGLNTKIHWAVDIHWCIQVQAGGSLSNPASGWHWQLSTPIWFPLYNSPIWFPLTILLRLGNQHIASLTRTLEKLWHCPRNTVVTELISHWLNWSKFSYYFAFVFTQKWLN